MKKMYKYLTLIPGVITLTSLSGACHHHTSVSEIKIKMQGIKYGEDSKIKEYTNAFNQIFNQNLMEAKLDNKVVSFHEAGGDESATISEINTNKFQVAFPGALRYYQEYQNNKNKSVSAFMQTKSLAFKTKDSLKFDDTSLYDVDKGPSNFATEQAEYENHLFKSEGGYVNWTKDSMGGYKNYKFTNMYEKDKFVDVQRGAIWIFGTEDERSNIKNAWINRRWDDFYKFGITYGENYSASKYHLPQALLRKQFDLNEAFTLDSFASTNSQYFGKIKAKELGKLDNTKYHIAFDNENSFAYTSHGSKELTKRDFYVKDSNKAYEILTLTDPIPYNVAIAHNSLSNDVLNILAQTFIELANNNKNYIGNLWGLNHYSIIDNEVENFINRIDSVLNI